MIDWRDLHRSGTHERVLAGTEVDRRRAISTLYYGLSHRLCAESAVVFAAGGAELEAKTRRAFNHGTMKTVCEEYVGAGRARRFGRKLDWQADEAPGAEVVAVAAAFIDLQEARHVADYELTADISPMLHASLLETAEYAHWQLDLIADRRDCRVFLAALLLHDRWTRRG